MKSVKISLLFCMLTALFFVVYGCDNGGKKCDPTKNCSSHGTCEMVKNRATCTCDAGFGGTQCEKCADGYSEVSGACVQMTSCSEQGACPTANKSVCDDSSGHVVCSCDKNYSEVNGVCISICEQSNPCTDTTNHKTQCKLNDSGVAVCLCDVGYIELGDTCVQATSCTPTNPCTEKNKNRCNIDSGGHVACGCNLGYQDDGTGGCEWKCANNPCPTDTNDTYRNVCSTDPGTGDVVCSCQSGYKTFGDGLCHLAVCGSSVCTDKHKTTCSPDPYSGIPTCSCDDTYTLVGVNCVHELGQSCGDKTDCASGHCAPQGICCDSDCNGNCVSCNSSGNCKADSQKACDTNCATCDDGNTGNCLSKGSDTCSPCYRCNANLTCALDVNNKPKCSTSCTAGGVCLIADNQYCTTSPDCVSGYCVANTCIEDGWMIQSANCQSTFCINDKYGNPGCDTVGASTYFNAPANIRTSLNAFINGFELCSNNSSSLTGSCTWNQAGWTPVLGMDAKTDSTGITIDFYTDYFNKTGHYGHCNYPGPWFLNVP